MSTIVADQVEEDHMVEERGPAYRQWLAGRTVAVVGLARSGVAAARMIRRLGGLVLASDAGSPESLSADARDLERLGCGLFTGGHPDAAFEGAELVVVSPGVPLELPALDAARARAVPLIGELELGWRVMEADLIAITGTNGKTTTTALTGELVGATVRPLLVGGNIGTPLCDHALDFPADGLIVAEASSFQLDTTELLRPRVAALLNVTPDHLDRHRTFERYVLAKAKIFANQTPADCAVLNADDPIAASLASRTRARVLWFSRQRPVDHGVFVRDGWVVAKLNGHVEEICPLDEIPLRGQHNVENVLAAAACALWTGLSPESIRRGIGAFRGVAHRIERVLYERGVTYYNDSKGTNVASTVKALESFAEPVILIAGGKGKGQDFAPLAQAARGRVKQAVLIGADRGQIRAALEATGVPCADAASMHEAVAVARSLARAGDVVLLSPACASFDMFDNYEHRGDVFKTAVRELAGAYKLKPDPWLFALVLGLVSLGVVMVYSASAIMAADRFHDPLYFLTKQLFWAVLGVCALWTGMRFDYRRLERFVVPLLGLSFALLVLVLVPPFGHEINGTRRWLRAGPVSFQPVELAKFSLLLYLAAFLTRRGEVLETFRLGLLPPLLVAGSMAVLTMLQPDMGNAVVLVILALALAYLAGARVSHMGLIAAAALPICAVAIAMKPYRLRRMVAFVNPWNDPQGSGFQIIQSFLALGSGGWLGRGLGESKQKLFYLPEAHTDFIFAIIGEELGLAGTLVVVTLFALLVWRGLRIGLRAPDGFGSYLALGLTIMLATQTLVNLGVVTGVLPTKGLPLPFISFGGSALLMALFSTGVLLNISQHTGTI